eukprot:4807823-Karenia_brevis.AAC.1
MNVSSLSAAISACRYGVQRQPAVTQAQLISVISYNPSLSTCRKVKQWLMMRQPGLMNVISFSAAISACEKRA